MATAAPRLDLPRRPLAASSGFNWVADGAVQGLFFRALLIVAPIQSVLLLAIQGTTPAFVLTLASFGILVGVDRRYFSLLAFSVGFWCVYALYMSASLSGYMIDDPDYSRLTIIRNVFVYGRLRQTHLTQGFYLFAALLFTYLIYLYYQEAFLKYAFYGILLLSFYGFYEFIYFALFHDNGDFISNRNFGDLDDAAAGVINGVFASGSSLQHSNLFGPGFMRLKSLVGEPSMYALTVTPFAVYAYARKWWLIFAILLISLVLSTASTAVIGLLVGLVYVEIRRRPEAILYVAGAAISVILLYATAEPVQRALDTLLFQKLDTTSGSERLNYFFAHASVIFDGNPIRALFGLGFGTVRSGDMLSNLLANVGLVGVLLYSALILGPCVLLRGGEDRNAIIAALLSIYFMEMLFVPEFGYLPPWFMVALGYARVRERHRLLAAPTVMGRLALR